MLEPNRMCPVDLAAWERAETLLEIRVNYLREQFPDWSLDELRSLARLHPTFSRLIRQVSYSGINPGACKSSA